jgi:serine/threonine-protein kinase
MSDPVARLNAALEGRYTVERKLGEGGMATVYLARDLRHNRNVALKVLKPELAAVVGADRFLAEIETTANLQHPHILPLFDSGEADGFLFYVMPYVEGETLRDRVDREKQLPVDEAVRIATAVANALQHAHDRGVIHRDIKPANILMQDGEPLVADFGIALAVGAAGGSRLTETGLSVGTPYYMSPEQATGDQTVGPASDTYALACVLYEMLVGDPPYVGSTAQAVLGKIIQGEPVSATAIRRSITANVDAAIRKALEKLPADRFTGAQDFARALADPGFRHGETAATAAGSGALWNPVSIAATLVSVVLAAALVWSLNRPGPLFPNSSGPSETTSFPLAWAIGRSRCRPMAGCWSTAGRARRALSSGCVAGTTRRPIPSGGRTTRSSRPCSSAHGWPSTAVDRGNVAALGPGRVHLRHRRRGHGACAGDRWAVRALHARVHR